MNRQNMTLKVMVEKMLADADTAKHITLINEHDELLAFVIDLDPSVVVYYGPGQYEAQGRFLSTPCADDDEEDFITKYYSFERKYYSEGESNLVDTFVNGCMKFGIDLESTEWGVPPKEIDNIERIVSKLNQFRFQEPKDIDE